VENLKFKINFAGNTFELATYTLYLRTFAILKVLMRSSITAMLRANGQQFISN